MQPLLLVGSVTKLPISPFHIFLVLSLTGLSLNVLNHPNFNEEVDIILNRSHNKPMLTWNLNAVRSNKLTAAFLFAIHAVFATCCIKVTKICVDTFKFGYFLNFFLFIRKRL